MHTSAKNVIKNLTYNPRLAEWARRLRLADILKTCDYRLRAPRDRIVRHRVAGVEVALSVPNPTEFRNCEHGYGHESDFLEALAKRLQPGDVYYDIGSNVGLFVIPMSKLVGEGGRVFAFEPHPLNNQRLMENVNVNRLTNTRVFQLALSDRCGEAEMFGQRATATIISRAAAHHQSLPTATVQTIRGDDLRRTEDLPIPKAVKIDVEGSEFAVLTGLTKTLSSPECEFLCCEIHPPFLPAEISPDMVISLVRSLGFRVLKTEQRGMEIHLVAEKVVN